MIKKGDNVIVLTGGSKGKKGKVLRVFPSVSKILVEGVNMKKKHQKPKTREGKGTTIEKAMPIHVSNVALFSGGERVKKTPKTVGAKKVRVAKKSE